MLIIDPTSQSPLTPPSNEGSSDPPRKKLTLHILSKYFLLYIIGVEFSPLLHAFNFLYIFWILSVKIMSTQLLTIPTAPSPGVLFIWQTALQGRTTNRHIFAYVHMYMYKFVSKSWWRWTFLSCKRNQQLVTCGAMQQHFILHLFYLNDFYVLTLH